jgi:hypothetical protein
MKLFVKVIKSEEKNKVLLSEFEIGRFFRKFEVIYYISDYFKVKVNS